MGVIAAQAQMPSAKFVNPANLDTIAPNKDFTIQMKISNVSSLCLSLLSLEDSNERQELTGRSGTRTVNLLSSSRETLSMLK